MHTSVYRSRYRYKVACMSEHEKRLRDPYRQHSQQPHEHKACLQGRARSGLTYGAEDSAIARGS